MDLEALFSAVDYARQYNPKGLLPVYVCGRPCGIMPIANADRLQTTGLIEQGSLETYVNHIAIASLFSPAEEVNSIFQTTASTLLEKKVKKPRDLPEQCLLASHICGQILPGLSYDRLLKDFFGLLHFGTHCLGYIHTRTGEIDLVLGVSGKESSCDQYDFTFGGNMGSILSPDANLSKEAWEETSGKIQLHEMLFRHASGFTSEANILHRNIRTIHQTDCAARNGMRHFYTLELPEGFEKELQGDRKEVQKFVRVPLSTLLHAWQQNQTGNPYSLKKFKHTVPIAIIAFAIKEGIIPDPDRILQNRIMDPTPWKACGRISSQPLPG